MAEIILPPDQYSDYNNALNATKDQDVSVTPVKDPFVWGVDWAVDGEWHTTEARFAEASGITKYRVTFVLGDLIGTQTIEFVTSEKLSYMFIDEDGEQYEVESSPEEPVQKVSRLQGGARKIIQAAGN